MTWDGLKTDPENGVVMNLNTAYLDAYASWVNASPKAGDKKNDDRYGGRVRFKYSF